MSHILIAEDDMPLAHLWRVAFQQAGFHVDLVHDGREAIHFIEKYPLPDVLLVDEVMPYTRGSQVINRLYELDGSHRVVTILSTAFSHLLDNEEVTRVDYFIQKPASFYSVAKLARSLAVRPTGNGPTRLNVQLA
jgi:two-component system copper resistance phosphate regulon response regulator CusR